MISLIVAKSTNNVIGKANSLPWGRMRADMRRFKLLTVGKPVVMGRRTYESLPIKPLPDRPNFVLSTNKDFFEPGVTVVHSAEEVLEKTSDFPEVMVIGGAAVFNQFLPLAEKIYLTQIDGDFAGDTFFPELGNEWREIHREEFPADEENPHRYQFLELSKVN